MAVRPAPETTAAEPKGRCRCGHPPTSHMVVRPVAGTGNFRLAAVGPCAVCGESACRSYTPGSPGAAASAQP